MRRVALVVVGLWAVAVLAAGVAAMLFLRHDEPDRYADIEEHFKYGSIGSEARYGVPERIWTVLPAVFADLLPAGEGEGWERFGLLYEEGAARPIGTSRREDPIALIGLNCAACHTGTVRTSPTAERQVVLGMPANQFDLRAYITFLRQVGRDPRFTGDVLVAAMKEQGQRLSWFQERFYRSIVVPETREALQRQDEEFDWFDSRPPWGPGRVDTFNPYKVFTDVPEDDTIGTSDLPTIFEQRPKDGLYLHWDGNNNSLTERNKSAAIGAGARPESLDLAAMERIEDWIADLPAPPYPGPIDQARAEAGRRYYVQACAACHDYGGDRVGQVTPIGEVGTDPNRLNSFTEELVAEMNRIGQGRPWAFSHFRKTDGYANAPLDAVWLRSPYLHNGSVPTLRALLFPEERPTVFYRRYDVYDFDRVGFASSGPEAEATGFRYDTTVPGNGNGGHLYGTELPPAQREAIIEYLKTR
jgi:mono/diheme cytochrome c family protein